MDYEDHDVLFLQRNPLPECSGILISGLGSFPVGKRILVSGAFRKKYSTAGASFLLKVHESARIAAHKG